MNRDNINSMINEKKVRLEEKLTEYKKSLGSNINRAFNSTDFENISTVSVRYATAIAKLEAEIQQLENMLFYVRD
ncbi:hypothetical protein [Brevibacillus sp. NRS-1366]|uniref:hypothetical protein n=1 Tax=Brevibacillus sp. NRS-1366 TaxID=3233899 RepID=UPI003D1E0C70